MRNVTKYVFKKLQNLVFMTVVLMFFFSCVPPEEKYISCDITRSSAPDDVSRLRDLEQCWRAPGNGYTEREHSTATAWCVTEVRTYTANHQIDYNLSYGPSKIECGG